MGTENTGVVGTVAETSMLATGDITRGCSTTGNTGATSGVAGFTIGETSSSRRGAGITGTRANACAN